MTNYPYLLYRNIERWGNGENFLFITGTGSSGKTTLSNQLAAENYANALHIDDLTRIMLFDSCKYSTREPSATYRKSFPSNRWGEYSWSDPDFQPMHDQYVKWVYNSRRNVGYKTIMEGIQIANCELDFMDFYKDKPIIAIDVNVSIDRMRHFNKFLEHLGDWESDMVKLGDSIRHLEWNGWTPPIDEKIPDHIPSNFKIEYLPNRFFVIQTSRPNWLTDSLIESCYSIAEESYQFTITDDCGTASKKAKFTKPQNTKNRFLVSAPFILANLVTPLGLYLKDSQNSYEAYIQPFDHYRIMFIKQCGWCTALLIDSELTTFCKHCGFKEIKETIDEN